MDQTPLFQYGAPKGASLEPPKSSKAILVDHYELRPAFIAMVQAQPFSREEDENPYTHLREFEQLCSCLHIQGMTRDTLKWKLFPFSLMGVAKHWYARHVGSVQGDWETLLAKFCLAFFPVSRVAHLRTEVLTFKQKDKEPLGASWVRFTDLISSGPDLAIPEPVLLQHFYLGLSKDSAQFLDIASRGAFLHLSASVARSILDKILENTPYTGIHDELPEEEEEAPLNKNK